MHLQPFQKTLAVPNFETCKFQLQFQISQILEVILLLIYFLYTHYTTYYSVYDTSPMPAENPPGTPPPLYQAQKAQKESWSPLPAFSEVQIRAFGAYISQLQMGDGAEV